ncbi:MAG: AAA family ATPase [Candidatus Aminicenantes bacterium]|nr:AAA family ATPase [Candidatus Aminicenantes bacterium]
MPPRLEMNLTDYLRVIRKRMRIIILSLFLVIASTIYYTNKQIPIYRTSCRVKIEQRKSVAEILTELVTWSPGDVITSQANLIKSYPIIEIVAEKLNAINPEMNESQRMGTIKGLQARITTEPIENTNIIAITVVSNKPIQATNLVNTVAEVYADFHFEDKKREAAQTKKFVKGQLDNYINELRESEMALQRFRQENPLVMERDITAGNPIQNDPRIMSLQQEIVKLDLELISLKSKYTDAHPAVEAVMRKLFKAREDLFEATNQVAAQQKDLSAKEIRLVQLKRNITLAEDMYSMFRTKHEEARILEAEKARDVTVIERASVPTTPISPNVSSNIMIGILSGLLIGFIMAFVTESLDTSIGRVDDIEEMLQVPVLGIIPSTTMEKGKKYRKTKSKKREQLVDGESIQSRLVTLFKPSSIAAEAYKSLRTNLDLTGLKKTGNSIVVTSAAPKEGKTQTLCNLAIAMAQAGQRVVLVGSDFRKPAVYKLFGLQRSPGLSEVLIGNVSWKEALNTVTDMLIGGFEYERILKARGIENIHIITCGERTPNPSELLNLTEMNNLIQELKQSFDVVLLDCPPTLPVADSAILGAKVDGVILVYQAGKTSRYALLRTKNQLEHLNVKIWGVVINNLKPRLIEDVTPYQRYRYYGYYGEKKTK